MIQSIISLALIAAGLFLSIFFGITVEEYDRGDSTHRRFGRVCFALAVVFALAGWWLA